MNGFIRTLVAQLPPQLVSPPAGGSIPWPRTPAAPTQQAPAAAVPPRRSASLRPAVSALNGRRANAAPRPDAASPPRGPAAPAWPRRRRPPPGSSAAAASTDAFGYAHMSATRSRLFGSGKMLAKCVPGCLAVARLCSDAFPKGPRTGKTPVRGNISPPCIQNELVLARYARHVSKKPCKSSLEDTPSGDLATNRCFYRPRSLKSCIARRSCHDSAFAGPYA